MARKLRLHIPGVLYHVMLRGYGGQDIFFDDEDRYHLYLLIQQGGGTIWPPGPWFLLHVEPHTLGYSGQVAENPLYGQGKKKVIDRRFIVEEKMDGCWRMIDF